MTRSIQAKNSRKRILQTLGILEKTETVKAEKKKKLMTNETTKLPMNLPVEVWVKIFNFLPNQDIRCGVSLACKKFREICQDESLVPVKDLFIYGGQGDGGNKLSYDLRDFWAVADIIIRSKNLTALKIKALNMDIANQLVSIALKSCPKLTHLEIVENHNMPPGPDLGPEAAVNDLMYTIEEFGERLSCIILRLNNFAGRDFAFGFMNSPELKTLTLESVSLDDTYLNLIISESDLKNLSMRCEELENLEIINAFLQDIIAEEEVKEIFPNCDVEIEDCALMCDECGEFGKYMSIPCKCIRDIYPDLDNSTDDSEQDSSSDSDLDADEINDILDDNSDGGEIEEGQIEEEENGN